MSPRSKFLVTALCLCLSPASTFAAEADFYFLADRWQKNQAAAASSPQEKKHSLENTFVEAARTQSSIQSVSSTSAAHPITMTLQEAASSTAPVEIEFGQSLYVRNPTSYIKYVSTEESVVTLQNPEATTLEVVGSGIGQTFVHAWDASGRKTFSVRVTQPTIVMTQSQKRQLDAFEKNRSFRFQYDNGRSASYTGDKFREAQRSSVDFTQNFHLAGDTPYGALDGYMQTQKSGGKTLLAEANTSLTDGKIGPLDNFNVTAGDSRVKPELMVFPSARVRGVKVEHWDDKKKAQWLSFYGRENTSVVGTISSGLLGKRTLNSHLYGTVLDYKVNPEASVKAGYFEGFGPSRADELNKHGVGLSTDIHLNSHHIYKQEFDFDNEHTAQQYQLISRFEKVRFKNEFRDISKKFYAITGTPSKQGEAGYVGDISYDLNRQWTMGARTDIFRDRRVPNPEDPKSVNIHSDYFLQYAPCEDVNYSLTLQDLDDTGRVGPTRQRTLAFQYSESFDAWGHRANLFSRYQHRASHNLTNSDSDYRNNQVVLGLYTPLFWNINFSIQKEWNALEEVELSNYTHPSALVYTWDWQRQLDGMPFVAEARVRLRDEEQTEADSSFMAGEDSAELSGSLKYLETEDLEIFLNGSLTQFVPEDAEVLSPRVEAQFYTGMRANIDTGFRWNAVGSFDGYVYKDQNGDGIRQPYEPGIKDMLIHAPQDKTALTDEKGYYQILGVSGKNVALSLDNAKIPYGFVPTSDSEVKLSIENAKTQRVDFGLVPRSDLTGIIFNDLNGDKQYTAGEPGVPKVKITLETGQAAKSSLQGTYTVAGVVSGEHTATLSIQSLPEGYLPTDVPTKKFTLYEGIRYELHFPLKAQRSLSGRVYYDKNNNNVWDSGESYQADIPVSLGKTVVSTDAEGWYLFDDVFPGNFDLRVEAGSVSPLGFKPAPAKSIEFKSDPLTLSGVDIPLHKQTD